MIYEESKKKKPQKISLPYKVLPQHKFLAKILKIKILTSKMLGILEREESFSTRIIFSESLYLMLMMRISVLVLLFLHLCFLGQLNESPHTPICGTEHYWLIQKPTAVFFSCTLAIYPPPEFLGLLYNSLPGAFHAHGAMYIPNTANSFPFPWSS